MPASTVRTFRDHGRRPEQVPLQKSGDTNDMMNYIPYLFCQLCLNFQNVTRTLILTYISQCSNYCYTNNPVFERTCCVKPCFKLTDYFLSKVLVDLIVLQCCHVTTGSLIRCMLHCELICVLCKVPRSGTAGPGPRSALAKFSLSQLRTNFSTQNCTKTIHFSKLLSKPMAKCPEFIKGI